MTIEQVKQFAKEKCNSVLTDAEAEAVLKECVKEGVLDDAELGSVSGGFSGHIGETVSYVIRKILENTPKYPRK